MGGYANGSPLAKLPYPARKSSLSEVSILFSYKYIFIVTRKLSEYFIISMYLAYPLSIINIYSNGSIFIEI